MKDRDLIEALYAGTIPRIKDIRDAVLAEADRTLQEQIDRGDWPFLVGATVEPQDPTHLDPVRMAEITRLIWGPPLKTIAVQLIRAIAAKATDGEFAVDEVSVAAICATIDEAELKRATGLSDGHVRPVLEKTAETFIGVVRAHGAIEISIDRQPIRLRAAGA